MNPEYYKTRFRTKEPKIQFPEEFIIITAYPTTGETWDQSRINESDQKLEKELKLRKSWMLRIEGYSPETGHAEPGWVTIMPLDEGRKLGLQFKQDAIFHVWKDVLSVIHCDPKGELVEIGSFRQRLDK